jgi:hypothetical protein
MAMPLAYVILCSAVVATAPRAGSLSWIDVAAYPGWTGPSALFSGPEAETFRSIRSQAEWNAFWPALRPMVPGPKGYAPAVDFGKFTMIVAALGTRPAGGFTVQVQSVRDDGSTVYVSVLEVRPGHNCTGTASLTYPIEIALIPRTEHPIKCEIGLADFDCSASRHAP